MRLREQLAQRTRELQASEARFRNVVTRNVDGILIVDTAGLVRFMNQAAETLLGRKAEELRALPFGLPLVEGETIEVDIPRRQGEIGIAEMRVAATEWEGKDAYLVLLHDVTARKQAEESVRAEAQVSAALVQVGRELTALLDTPVMLDRLCQLTTEVLECECSHTLLWRPQEDAFSPVAGYGDTAKHWNALRARLIPRAAIADFLVRLEQEEIIQVTSGVTPHLLPPGLAGVFSSEAGLYLALRRGSHLVGIQTAGFRSRHGVFSAQQQRLAQGIAQIASLAFANDRLWEELKQANRFKADFLATMSHELLTPLSVIMGYTQLLLGGDFGRVKTSQADILRRIDKSARDFLGLITATLDVSRLEKEGAPLQVQEVRLADLIGEVELEMSELRQKPKVRFAWHVEAALPVVWTDRAKLKLVLKNLLSNAMKFTEVGCISVSAQARGGGMEICVKDTGSGITTESLSVIFESFRQGADPLTRRQDGIGLGLYVVRRMVELLGGSVSVDSTPGEGSLFRVWVPSREEQGQARLELHTQEQPHEKIF